MNEISRRDEVSLSGAALRGAPWKAAAVGGGVVAAASYGMGVILPGTADLVWALGLGISLFALIAAIGAVSKPNEGDRVTRQARLWALRHPWKFALLPAGIAAVLDYPVQLVLDGEGVIGSAFHSVWHGALVYLIAGILTVTMKGRARS
ncbi:hypothetical protein ACWGH8_08280 [Nonomuraea muscovyensis]|jgi:hypothetical protein|uniref:Uncharacterized protein n=1 Tax=Nonomuraea muscovyensis TaxID=1124761 RepID=A0A7X0C0E6_9ACTN|nr:hypothetical protein [Nonomuraea muscovyensis]MBB6345421.1 hypothetical protein [Nonomuraea muscovyensis]MDF2712623.1 hypothetical protein [Nonomuraea muscovyensis]